MNKEEKEREKYLKKNIFPEIRKLKIDYEREHFVVVYLNGNLKVIGKEILFIGGLYNLATCNYTLFRRALLKGAAGMIVGHNHPSTKFIKDLEPSHKDLVSFRKMFLLGEVLGVRVLCDIVFNKRGFINHGIMANEWNKFMDSVDNFEEMKQ